MRPAKRAWQSRCRSTTSSRTSARSCGRDKTERRTEGADRAKRFRRQSITVSKKQRAKPLQFVLERTLLYTVAVVHILTLNPILGVKIGVRRTCENMLWNSPQAQSCTFTCTPAPLHPSEQMCADVRRASVENRVSAPAVRFEDSASASGPAPTFSGSAFRSNSRPGSRSFCRGSKKPPRQHLSLSSLAPSQAGAEGAPKRHNEACPPRPRHTRLSSSLELYSLHVPAAEYSGPGFMMCLSADATRLGATTCGASADRCKMPDGPMGWAHSVRRVWWLGPRRHATRPTKTS